ncbi:hypothetical protein BV25DRAFT_1832951 [Artomyces pyxidatus]|uniref:Uncharacterized protein n=1 Tax=Artomyces pyxidatus TaxID=48021 RepID=A0ACB8SGF5_9AGAM|nr:hypothetical protein BV25DRAFT_1832951 [Artomyces pyxidatus]
MKFTTIILSLALALSVSAAPASNFLEARKSHAGIVRYENFGSGSAVENGADSVLDTSAEPDPDTSIGAQSEAQKREIFERTIQQLYNQLVHGIHKGRSQVDSRDFPFFHFGGHQSNSCVSLASLTNEDNAYRCFICRHNSALGQITDHI